MLQERRRKGNPAGTSTTGEERTQGADGYAHQSQGQEETPTEPFLKTGPDGKRSWGEGHCAKIYYDLEEDKDTQERRIRAFREEGDRQKEEEREE